MGTDEICSKEDETVFYGVLEDRNDVRPLKLSHSILAWQLGVSISAWKVWRHVCPQKLNRVQFCVLYVFITDQSSATYAIVLLR